MTEFGMIDALNDPQMRHAMLAHFPIVLSILAVITTLIAAIFFRRPFARWMAAGVLVALLISTFVAVNTGEDAEQDVPGLLSDDARDALQEHQALAERAWMFGAGALALVILSAVPIRAIRLATAWLSVGVCLVLSGWIANTAHHGGLLVYRFGIGMPLQPVARTEPPPDDSADPRLVHFRTEVLPTLVDHCFRCHNPETRARRRNGALDLTSFTAIFEGGRSGPVITIGNPELSLLVSAIRWADDELEMPPDDDKLSEQQIAAIEQWIRDGAVWENPTTQ